MIRPSFELVLPCYNEIRSLPQVIDRVINAASEYGYGPDNFKLLLVENGSGDGSKIWLKNAQKDPQIGPWLKVLYLEINEGYGNGLFQGVRATESDFVAWSHSDEQTDPVDAFRALDLICKSSSQKVVIKGQRVGRDFKDIMISRFFELLAMIILKKTFFEINAQPKVFHKSFIKFLTHPPKDFAFDLYALYTAKKNGYKIEEIEVKFPPRIHGFSNWASNFKGRLHHGLALIRYMRKLSRAED